jgi:hypothetical protein
MYLVLFDVRVSGDLKLYFIWRFENVEIFF